MNQTTDTQTPDKAKPFHRRFLENSGLLGRVTPKPSAQFARANAALDLRPMTSDELPEVVAAAKAVAEESGPEGQNHRFIADGDEKHFARAVKAIGMAKGCRIVLTADGEIAGFIAGHCQPSYMRKGTEAGVIFWFVAEPWRRRGYGTTLLRAFEAWAKRQGAKRVYVSARPTSGGPAIFRGEGYRLFEFLHCKEI